MTVHRLTSLVAAAAAVAAATALAGVPVQAPSVAGEPARGGGGHHHAKTLRQAAPHGFVIGSAVAGGGHHVDQPYPDPFPNDRVYRHLLGREFSSVSPENQMKWEFIHPEPDRYRFGPADDIVRFARQHHQVVRGHTLLWHNQNPAWLTEGDFSATELRRILRDHIFTVVGHYRGRIHQWDVANEVLDDNGQLRTSDNIWLRELGPGIIADAFRWAHRADPRAQLFFNDYGVESINPKSTGYLTLISDLLEQGVPVDGFSVQGHLSTRYGFPDDLAANLQRFADLGLRTAVTEVDVRMDLPGGAEPTDAQLAQQADYYQRMLEGCLAVDTCRSFTVWGFTDKYSWVPVFFPDEGAATIMTEDFERKPAYYALRRTLADAR